MTSNHAPSQKFKVQNRQSIAFSHALSYAFVQSDKVLSSCPAFLACSFGICIISTVAHAFTLASSTLISVLWTDLFLSNICEDFLHCFGPFSTVPGMFRVLSIWSITVRHFWWALSWFLWISHSVSYPSLGLFWHTLGFFTTFFLCKCTL